MVKSVPCVVLSIVDQVSLAGLQDAASEAQSKEATLLVHQ